MATLVPPRLRRLAASFLDVLLPRTCAACRAIVTSPEAVCGGCQETLAAMPIPELLLIPVAGGSTLRAQALFPFAGPARELLHALKYQNRRDAALPIAALAATRWGPALAGATLLPVPLHPRRERMRGYNQSEVLAAAIAEATGAEFRAVLVRKRATHSQTKLGREARAGNVAGAFAFGGPLPQSATVILVDDVVTTGATLGAVASALSTVRVAELRALTAAREL